MSGKSGLTIADGLSLPLDLATQSISLVAVKGAGKSNAAAVTFEQMYAHGIPSVAIDPKGDWWGVRSNAAGTGPGLPVPIFGGHHGDMPLLPEAGRLIAELIFGENLTCVLDVSTFASQAARMRFLADFGERLYWLHGKDPCVRHLILEEGHEVVPQVVRAEMARCVGTWTSIATMGRQRGLGITLATQRSARVNKDVLTQTELLIAMRTTSPQDRKAIEGWVSHHAVGAEIVDSLPGLDDGEAWLCSSHWLAKAGLPAVQRIRFRRRSTYDSGATPVLARKARPATLADIDLTVIGARMAEVAEKAAADDPKALRRKIAELERKLAAKAPPVPDAGEVARLQRALADALARPAEQVEVPVLPPGDIAALDQSVTAMKETAERIELALRAAQRATAPTSQAPRPPVASRPAVTASAPQESAREGFTLGRAHRAILTVLAQFPDGRTKNQVAALSGYSVKSSGFGNALGALRSAGFINRGVPVQATPEGIAALGGDWEPLPAGPELIEHWMSKLGKAERAILRVFLDAWPTVLTKDEVAERSGYSATSSGFGNALGKLRSLQLVNGWEADETLAQHAQGGIHA